LPRADCRGLITYSQCWEVQSYSLLQHILAAFSHANLFIAVQL
jgi:hypothetical protein